MQKWPFCPKEITREPDYGSVLEALSGVV